MAIAPTGDIYKSLSFDNTSSRTYGVYITGEAVYNAPERDVEMITIPGRNGAFALDNGRFQNIEVTYPAGIFADTEADFAQAISDFRNFLCSKEGYCRLTDEYNPNEYRMAVYKSGLEVTPAQLRAGEFNITFECMPQRWLTSGETAVAVASGGTLTNPTLFESQPLLEVEGYGEIELNGYGISVDNGVMGNVILWDKGSSEAWYIATNASGITRTRTIPSGLLNTGDAFTIGSLTFKSIIGAGADSEMTTGSASVSHSGISDATVSGTVVNTAYNSVRFTLDVTIPAIDFVYGTPKSVADTENYSATYTVGGSPRTRTFSRAVSISYDGVETITINFTAGGEGSNFYFTIPEGSGYSTISIMGHPTYIDCDLGEVYKIESGSLVSLNAYIDLGSDLPKLASGSNTITYDNTITDLKVVPRWWKI